MKDASGVKLEKNDRVAFCLPDVSQLSVGVVEYFTEKMVSVLYSTAIYKTSILRFSNQVVKIN